MPDFIINPALNTLRRDGLQTRHLFKIDFEILVDPKSLPREPSF